MEQVIRVLDAQIKGEHIYLVSYETNISFSDLI
jgi:hypothetical protein